MLNLVEKALSREWCPFRLFRLILALAILFVLFVLIYPANLLKMKPAALFLLNSFKKGPRDLSVLNLAYKMGCSLLFSQIIANYH